MAVFSASVVFNNKSIVAVSFARVSIGDSVVAANRLHNIRTVASSADTSIVSLYSFAFHHAVIIVGLSIVPADWSIVSSITVALVDAI